MRPTRRWLLAGAGAAAGAAVWATRSPPRRTDGRPNIVVILTDDQGYDGLGCYAQPGQEAAGTGLTPHLDAMAAEGRHYSEFYVAAPVCTPSRAALMTGCYPPRVGFGASTSPEGLGVLDPTSTDGLDPAIPTLPRLLGAAGYDTALVGKWHLGSRAPHLPTRCGFDEFYGVPWSHNMSPLPLMHGESVVRRLDDEPDLTGVFTRAALTWLRGRSLDHPFFLMLAYTAPHAPWVVPPAWRGATSRGPYADAIAQMDDGVGALLALLDERGLDEQTLVFFTTDNGPWIDPSAPRAPRRRFRGGKGETTEGGMRSPAILRWRGRVTPTPAPTPGLVTALDLLPTFAHLAGADPPPAVDGRELASTLLDGAPSPRTHFAYYARGRLEAIRDGEGHKRSYAVAERTPPVAAALYDLRTDPGEAQDLTETEPAVLAALEAEAQRMRDDLGDALRAP